MKVRATLRSGLFVIIAVMLFSTIGCMVYHLNPPPSGVTKYMIGDSVKSAKYFEKFDSAKGLFAYSYVIIGPKGSTVTGTKYDTLIGVRVTQYNFMPNEPDSVFRKLQLQVWNHQTAFGAFVANSADRNQFQSLYKRGRLVYGGRYTCTAKREKAEAFASTPENDSLFNDFLNNRSEPLKKIPIDTFLQVTQKLK